MIRFPPPRPPPSFLVVDMNEISVSKSWCFCAAALLLLLLGLSTGCESTEVGKRRANGPPLPVFRGDKFLYGTVGSMAGLRTNRPTLVTGYGLIILPKGSGTGSSDVPSYLRQWFLNEMRRKGVGRFEFGAQDLSPRQLLISKDTAVVRIEGLIPPSSPKGTKFPVLVTALENTQTTSLEGGSLWTADLSIGGYRSANTFSKPLATARGDVYINPFDAKKTSADRLTFQRQGVILAGGSVQKDQPIELLLNQPDYNRSRLIADRINERFPHENAAEFFNTAVARSDLAIRINIPKQFAGNPQKLLGLIGHLYIQRSPNFEESQAQRLGNVLVANPTHAARVSEAWQALGKLALPEVRRYYSANPLPVRLAALEAGTWLQDEVAAIELQKMSVSPNPESRLQVAQLLRRMPKSRRASRTLQALVDDPTIAVRLAAYRSLSAVGDPTVTRVAIGHQDKLKFYLDVVRAKDPLIYVSQELEPRIVVFSPNTGFKDHTRAALWDGRLRLSGGNSKEPMRVFFQPQGETNGKAQQIAPTVANLAFLMGHRPSAAKPIEGFDLSYGVVVNAIYELQKKGYVEAQMRIGENALAKSLDEFKKRKEVEVRPEVAPVDELPEAASANQLRNNNSPASALRDDGGRAESSDN